ncbi:MAG: nucleotidyltransferase domain-containing protein [Candidatus Thorarchaeota archaeon]
MDGYKKQNTKVYLIAKEEFPSVKKIETDSLLPGFILKILLRTSNFNEKIISYNDLYKALFYIGFGKFDLLKLNVITAKSNENFILEIQNKLVLYEQVLKHLQELPICPKYFVTIIAKIVANIENSDLSGLLHGNESNYEILLHFKNKIEKRNIDWVLVGSTNLAIQGLPIKAKDIDIVTTRDAGKQIFQLFNKSIKKNFEFSESENFRSWFGILEIDKITLEIMAELEYKNNKDDWIKSNSLENKKFLQFRNKEIPILPLENEREFYIDINRENDKDKIKLIDEFMNKI